MSSVRCAVRSTPIADHQIRSLRGARLKAYQRFEHDLARQGCAALGYRLTGENPLPRCACATCGARIGWSWRSPGMRRGCCSSVPTTRATQPPTSTPPCTNSLASPSQRSRARNHRAARTQRRPPYSMRRSSMTSFVVAGRYADEGPGESAGPRRPVPGGGGVSRCAPSRRSSHIACGGVRPSYGQRFSCSSSPDWPGPTVERSRARAPPCQGRLDQLATDGAPAANPDTDSAR